MQIRIMLPIALGTALTALPAPAQIYKWVDAHGVVNYSNQPPADPALTGSVGIVEDNISVYTPDSALMKAVEAARRGIGRVVATAAAEQPRAIPSSGPQYAVPETAIVTLDPCAGSRAIHCYDGYHPHLYAAPPIVFHRRPATIPRIQLKPGATAGNVVGMDGYIPGNSVDAGRRFIPRPRPSMPER